MSSIRISIRQKGNASNVKMLLVSQHMTLEQLIKKASTALGGTTCILYFQNGSTVDDIRLLRDNDNILAELLMTDESKMDEYQVAVMGPGGVGKSAITIRFCQNDFVEDYDPTIEDAYRHHFVVDAQSVTLDIMDTAGQDEYSALRQTWMQESKGFVLVFDLTSPSTLTEVRKKFVEKLREVHEDRFPPVVLVGNKADLKEARQVSRNDAVAVATKMGAVAYMETSAKTGTGIMNVFHKLVKELRARFRPRESTASSKATNLKLSTKSFFCVIL